MGLLDNIDGDTILSGLLSAGAASGAKGPYLARVAAGLAQGERFKQGRAEQARQRSQDEMQAEYRQLQKRKLEMDMAREQRAQQEQDSMRGLAKQFMIPGAPASAGMPANEMDSGMDMGAVAAKPARYDFAGYANALSAINPSAGFDMQQKLVKDAPKPITVAKGARVFDPVTKAEIFSNPEPVAPAKDHPQLQLLKGIYGENTPEYLRAAQALGVKTTTHQPGTVVNAGVNLPTQEKEQSKEYGKSLGEIRASIQKSGFEAPQKLSRLARMETLLADVDGGKLAPLGMNIASAAQSLGVKIDPKLGNKEAAAALAIEMALAMRQPGSGATSDRDFDNWLATTPDLGKSAEGRKQIVATVRAKATRDIQIAKMASQYARKNGGVIDDQFMEELAQFQASNPVVFGGSVGGNAALDAALKLYPPRR